MRVWQVLALVGGLGLASLLLLPIETLVPPRLPWWALRAASLVQPALLTAAAIWCGTRLGPRLGLGTPLTEAVLTSGDAGAVLSRQLSAALPAGLLVAAVLIVYEREFAPLLATGSAAAARLAAFKIPVVTRLLYGGIVEELVTRFGLVTLFAWLLARSLSQGASPTVSLYWLAIGFAALLFAFGHLPVVYLLAPHPPARLVAAVIVGNALPGMIFGWLFWRRGLEAAMIAHATAHAVAAFSA